MKILHISDSHSYHGLLPISEGIDMIIHSGDISNPREVIRSEQECLDAIEWLSSLDIKHKILIAGNHDIAIERRRVSPGDIAAKGIVYLENNSTVIEGLKIWGSPITPSFGEGWAFNKKRDKIHEVWAMIPEDVDIIVTHGPPKGILDHSYSPTNVYERCGCQALKKRILQLNAKLVCFGHIHNTEDIINAGTTTLSILPQTIFSNGSIVTDGKFGRLSSHGNIFTI